MATSKILGIFLKSWKMKRKKIGIVSYLSRKCSISSCLWIIMKSHNNQKKKNSSTIKTWAMEFSPMESGSCCNIFDDNRRSSSPSHPDMSKSTVSILFFDISRYTSCFNFPIDLIACYKVLLEQIETLAHL